MSYVPVGTNVPAFEQEFGNQNGNNLEGFFIKISRKINEKNLQIFKEFSFKLCYINF